MFCHLNELTWLQLSKLDKEKLIVVLPIGAMEQHGRHLPLGTDHIIADQVVEGLGEMELQAQVACLPTIPYGNSFEHVRYNGTMTISGRTLICLVEDILSCLSRAGFRRLVLLNSHGGNTGILQGLAQEWEDKYGVKIYNIDFWSGSFFSAAQCYLDTPTSEDIHAGEIETSVLEYRAPQLIDKEELTPENDNIVRLKDYYFGWNTTEVAPENGMMGAASRSTPEKGKQIYQYVVKKVAAVLEEIAAE